MIVLTTFFMSGDNPLDLEVAYFQTHGGHSNKTGKQWEIDQEIWRCCGIHP